MIGHEGDKHILCQCPDPAKIRHFCRSAVMARNPAPEKTDIFSPQVKKLHSPLNGS